MNEILTSNIQCPVRLMFDDADPAKRGLKLGNVLVKIAHFSIDVLRFYDLEEHYLDYDVVQESAEYVDFRCYKRSIIWKDKSCDFTFKLKPIAHDWKLAEDGNTVLANDYKIAVCYQHNVDLSYCYTMFIRIANHYGPMTKNFLRHVINDKFEVLDLVINDRTS
jgi:hypothetical protein